MKASSPAIPGFPSRMLIAGLSCVAIWASLRDSRADPATVIQSETSCARERTASCDADNNGADYTRPQNSVDVKLSETASSGRDSRKRQSQLSVQWTAKIDLGADWQLGLKAQLPADAVTTTASAPPQTFHEMGLGGAISQIALIRAIDARWAFGVGARVQTPNLTNDLGVNGWQVMPGAGVRVMLPEVSEGSYFVPTARYAIGFAAPASARKISELQIAPTLNIQLSNRWFVTLFPSNDVRINYGGAASGQTGRLFLPMDLSVGRLVNDNLIVSLEASVPLVKDYPVYDFKTELRVTAKF
jgi:hypothetical protein